MSPKEVPEMDSSHEQRIAKKQTIATKSAAKPAKKAAKKTATKGSSGVTKNVVPSSSVKDDDSSEETGIEKGKSETQGESDEARQQNLI